MTHDDQSTVPTLAAVPDHVPADLVHDFDYLNTGGVEAYTHWNKLHDGRPPITYTRHQGGHWIVSAYEDVAHVLSAYGEFSSCTQTIPKKQATSFPPANMIRPIIRIPARSSRSSSRPSRSRTSSGAEGPPVSHPAWG